MFAYHFCLATNVKCILLHCSLHRIIYFARSRAHYCGNKSIDKHTNAVTTSGLFSHMSCANPHRLGLQKHFVTFFFTTYIVNVRPFLLLHIIIDVIILLFYSIFKD